MNEPLLEMLRVAREQEQVVEYALENDMHMFVYPMAGQGFLVGVGCQPDQAHQARADVVLRRRADDISRYGRWLPALFADGSWYLMQRLHTDVLETDGSPLSLEELHAAKELLS